MPQSNIQSYPKAMPLVRYKQTTVTNTAQPSKDQR